MKRTIVTALVVAVLGGAAYYYLRRPAAVITPSTQASAPAKETVLAGTVMKSDTASRKLSIKEQDGTVAVVDVRSDATIDLGAHHRQGTLSSLKKGENVSITLEDGIVKAIRVSPKGHKTAHLAQAKHSSARS